MKPRTLAARIAFAALIIGIWASVALPFNTEQRTSSRYGRGEVTSDITFNFWGQPLRSIDSRTVLVNDLGGAKPKELEVVEAGAFPGFQRNGPWTQRARMAGGEWITTTRWYLRGKEVSREDWERGR